MSSPPPPSIPPDSQSDPRTILGACQMIENLCARLYSEFARAHAADFEAHFVWNKTAEEELNHAQQIAMALRLSHGKGLEPNVDLGRAHATIAMLRSSLRAARAKPPSVVDALRTALTFEEHLSQFHLEEATVIDDPAMKALFRAMQAADRQHVEMLRALLSRRVPAAAT